jgi:hypothetical protein
MTFEAMAWFSRFTGKYYQLHYLYFVLVFKLYWQNVLVQENRCPIFFLEHAPRSLNVCYWALGENALRSSPIDDAK